MNILLSFSFCVSWKKGQTCLEQQESESDNVHFSVNFSLLSEDILVSSLFVSVCVIDQYTLLPRNRTVDLLNWHN